MKKLIVLILVVMLVLSSVSTVFAAEFCSVCSLYSAEEYCGNTPHSTVNLSHPAWDPVEEELVTCNYQKMYYRNYYECPLCDSWWYGGSHYHSQIFHSPDTSSNGVYCNLEPK